MSISEALLKQREMLASIIDFVNQTTGLRGSQSVPDKLRLVQAIDQKTLDISAEEVAGILPRVDGDGQPFLQVNFATGSKILITKTLIGFKPLPVKGVDIANLPRVVTTPDIVSVFEAIQDTLDEADISSTELMSLKRLFQAVIDGGENVGFDLSIERNWLNRIPSQLSKSVI